MSLKRLLVAAATTSTMKKSGYISALTKQSTANSSEKGKEKQPLTKKAIGR